MNLTSHIDIVATFAEVRCVCVCVCGTLHETMIERTHTCLCCMLYPNPVAMQIAGVPALPGSRGSSLVPFLKAQSNFVQRKDYVAMEYHSNYAPCGSYALRKGPYKLIRFGHSTPWDNASAMPDQLFDVDADPHELHDLAASNPAVVAALVATLEAEWGGSGSIASIEAAQMTDNIANYCWVWHARCTPQELFSAYKNTWAGVTDEDIVAHTTAWSGLDPRNATGPGGSCRPW